MRATALRLLLAASAFMIAPMANAQHIETPEFVISELRSDWAPSEGLVVIPPASVTITNLAGCSFQVGAGITAANNPAYKTISAILMAAFLSGKKVRLHFYRDASRPWTCAVGRTAFIGVDVINTSTP